jgi:hypothetical protein
MQCIPPKEPPKQAKYSLLTVIMEAGSVLADGPGGVGDGQGSVLGSHEVVPDPRAINSASRSRVRSMSRLVLFE